MPSTEDTPPPKSPQDNDDLQVRVRIHYVGGAEGAALRAAQSRALRALIAALAAARTSSG
jgi:hypothetical protein